MSHSFANIRLHIVFSTRERRNLIPAELQPDLWRYIVGVARNHGMDAYEVGGTANHVHVLVSIPPAISCATAVQVLKANSSRWLAERIPRFRWQNGYGAFSVSASVQEAVRTYINTQAEHHRKYSFEDEFLALLAKHGLTVREGQVFVESVPSLRDSDS